MSEEAGITHPRTVELAKRLVDLARSKDFNEPHLTLKDVLKARINSDSAHKVFADTRLWVSEGYYTWAPTAFALAWDGSPRQLFKYGQKEEIKYRKWSKTYEELPPVALQIVQFAQEHIKEQSDWGKTIGGLIKAFEEQGGVVRKPKQPKSTGSELGAVKAEPMPALMTIDDKLQAGQWWHKTPSGELKPNGSTKLSVLLETGNSLSDALGNVTMTPQEWAEIKGKVYVKPEESLKL